MLTPLISVLIAYAFMALDAIASELEDPFGTEPNDLALDAMCVTVERSLLEQALARAGVAEAELTSSWESYVAAGVKIKKTTGGVNVGVDLQYLAWKKLAIGVLGWRPGPAVSPGLLALGLLLVPALVAVGSLVASSINATPVSSLSGAPMGGHRRHTGFLSAASRCQTPAPRAPAWSWGQAREEAGNLLVGDGPHHLPPLVGDRLRMVAPEELAAGDDIGVDTALVGAVLRLQA